MHDASESAGHRCDPPVEIVRTRYSAFRGFAESTGTISFDRVPVLADHVASATTGGQVA